MTKFLSRTRVACCAALLFLGCGGDDTPDPAPETDAGPDSGESMADAAEPEGPECGDGTTESGEACDDGNTDDGDGCNAQCEVEDGWGCEGQRCFECGDGELDSTEDCDDGNRSNGDGCSETCRIESGWNCSDDGQICEFCGNGIVEANERCDEGDFADGVGCQEDCRDIDEHFTCPQEGQPCVECGNGVVEGDEVCDDGNTDSGDGCLAGCTAIESGFTCPEEGGACSLCGDGVLDALTEECDDGNFQSDDGCSDTCRKEEGAVCLEAGVLCSVCGNGFLEFVRIDDNGTPDDPSDDFYDTDDPDAREACDDGNHESGDGCSASCGLEDGGDLPWSCPLPGLGCGRCGDGVVQAIETCDDGVAEGSGLPEGDDGCSADCTSVEPGYLCPDGGGACVECGDGVLDTELEECDDGNTQSGDGCNRHCELETDVPWACPVAGERCELCGNGAHETHEGCDDGNLDDGDGCSAACQIESDEYNCYFEGFLCARCGDGVLQPGEQCDEGHLGNPDNLTDGCDNCQRVEPWNCPEAGASCEYCGDGIIGSGDPFTAFETCDDGNTLTGDGCGAECQVEPGFVCDGDSCSAAACGDGFVAAGEECDDGNRMAGDGCGFLCQTEPGFDCSGADGCHRSVCGDGLVEGDEQCDDGRFCSNGGTPCFTQAAYDACVDGGGTCLPEKDDGCDLDCQLEDGFVCDSPGLPCGFSYCGDGIVEGTEQCDVGGAVCDADSNPCVVPADFDACELAGGSCIAVEANGCFPDCTLKPGFACEAGETCGGIDLLTDCCFPTYCGDGVVEGSEECDDGMAVCAIDGSGTGLDGTACPDGDAFEACKTAGGSCLGEAGDGCALDCTIESFYRCNEQDGTASLCRPIVEYVSIRRFTIARINPDGLYYNPERRSFAGHKDQGSQDSIELCLDGTILDKGDTSFTNGSIDRPGEPLEELPADYIAPLRPNMLDTLQAMNGATFDPVSGDFLFTYARAGTGTKLIQLPPDVPRTSVDIDIYSVNLDFDAHGLTVGEDGDLYVVDQTAEVIRVLERRRENGLPLPAPDCSDPIATPDPAGENCTSFSPSPIAELAAPSDTPLDAIFTLPGESLVGVFNAYAGAPTYDGIDLSDNSPVNATANYFSIYDIESMDAPERSKLPGVLFSLGVNGTSYAQEGRSAETAADGGAFIICTATNGEDCQLFSRTCETDADCPPGTLCNLEGLDSVGVAYCNAPGAARDDIFVAERDVHKECASPGPQNGLDCTDSSTDCEADSGTCGQVGELSPEPLDVLSNDSLSESACLDPRFTILAICGDGVEQTYETANADSCPDDVPGRGTIALTPEGEVTYDAPDDGSCGFYDTFVYTVDLGGGVIDTAQVRVAVNCVCGDGIVDGNEQCDDGAFNGPPGACVEFCDDVDDDPDNDVPARCGESCLLNVLCGDGYLVSPEECDDGNAASGDGCSSVCTRESDCGNAMIEPGEDCDDGPAGSATCNPNCTAPTCPDGNIDRQLGEECDDGNQRLGDGCDDNCHIEARCGNGTVEPSEDCDDGNATPGDGCSATCHIENACGNGVLEGAEVCDGSEFGSCPIVMGVQIQCINADENAPNVCLCANYCGDGHIGGDEECDAGTSGSDSCRGADPGDGLPCTEIRCGDGVTDPGEACDDGNTNPADACDNSCQPRQSCGNGTVETPEECDDGNNVSGDGCTSTCQVEAQNCGDGIVDPDEQCDDGNTNSGDGCSINCREEGSFCGDGTRDPGEECDDGNTTNGDGCSAACRQELL